MSVLALLVLTLHKYCSELSSRENGERLLRKTLPLTCEMNSKRSTNDLSFHSDQSETGELLSRAIQDVERVRFLTGRATLRILEAVLLLIITLVIMLVMDYKQALLILVTIPILVFQAIRFGVRFRPLSLKVQKQLAVLTTAVEQNLRGNRVVKAYAQEEAEISRFEKENEHWFNLSNRSARMQAVNVPLLFLIANLGTVAIVLYGGNQVIDGSLTIGEVVAFISYLGQLIDPSAAWE
jgi:ATP-binding cassette subfamily B protein